MESEGVSYLKIESRKVFFIQWLNLEAKGQFCKVLLLSFLVCIFIEASGELKKNESDDTKHLAEKHGSCLQQRRIKSTDWKILSTWRKGWLKKTPLPSVSPTEFSEVCMSASLTKTVFNDPVTTMRTDMMISFVLFAILSVCQLQKINDTLKSQIIRGLRVNQTHL